MIKHVIFDCDGVLVDTEIVAAHTVATILSDHGVTVTPEEYIKTYTGRLLSDIYRDLLNLTDQEITDLTHQTDYKIYKNLVPVAGMDNVVKSIDLEKSVVSNSALWQVEKALDTINLSPHFIQKVSAEMVLNPKPSPDVYLLAAKNARVTPNECLVVEDSKSGVTAAVSAGMHVIGFTGASHILAGHAKALKEIGATQIADSPSKLLRIILNKLNT